MKKPTAPKAAAKLGASIDTLRKLQQKRLDLQRKVDAMKADETALEQQLIAELHQAGLESARGKLASVTITPVSFPTVEDWDTFYAHVRETGEFELLERRVAVGACRERWDAKITVPGVKRDGKLRLSLHGKKA